MSRRFSDSLDLSKLGPVPYDLRPRRTATPEESRRLIDACRADDRRCSEDVARWEAVNAPAHPWPDDDAPAVPDARDAACGFCGLVTVLALAVAARFAWDALTLEGRVVLGCLAAWFVLLWWRRMGGPGR